MEGGRAAGAAMRAHTIIITSDFFCNGAPLCVLPSPWLAWLASSPPWPSCPPRAWEAPVRASPPFLSSRLRDTPGLPDLWREQLARRRAVEAAACVGPWRLLASSLASPTFLLPSLRQLALLLLCSVQPGRLAAAFACGRCPGAYTCGDWLTRPPSSLPRGPGAHHLLQVQRERRRCADVRGDSDGGLHVQQ